MITCELHQSDGVVEGTMASEFCEVCQIRRDIDDLRKALAPLVAIADAYDRNALDDEARKWWGTDSPRDPAGRFNDTPPEQIELVSGRGGMRLLTLAQCLDARRGLRRTDAYDRNAPARPCSPEDPCFLDQCPACRTFPSGSGG
jgi:hypothetical protein